MSGCIFKVKLSSCPPGGEMCLFNFKVNLKPALFLFGCVPAREPRAACIPTVPCGTPTGMWTSFWFLRYVGALQRRGEGTLLVTVYCARAQKNATHALYLSKVSQKNEYNSVDSCQTMRKYTIQEQYKVIVYTVFYSDPLSHLAIYSYIIIILLV